MTGPTAPVVAIAASEVTTAPLATDFSASIDKWRKDCAGQATCDPDVQQMQAISESIAPEPFVASDVKGRLIQPQNDNPKLNVGCLFGSSSSSPFLWVNSFLPLTGNANPQVVSCSAEYGADYTTGCFDLADGGSYTPLSSATFKADDVSSNLSAANFDLNVSGNLGVGRGQQTANALAELRNIFIENLEAAGFSLPPDLNTVSPILGGPAQASAESVGNGNTKTYGEEESFSGNGADLTINVTNPEYVFDPTGVPYLRLWIDIKVNAGTASPDMVSAERFIVTTIGGQAFIAEPFPGQDALSTVPATGSSVGGYIFAKVPPLGEDRVSAVFYTVSDQPPMTLGGWHLVL